MGSVLAFLAVAWLRLLRYRWSRLQRALFERRNSGVELPPARTVEEVADLLAQVTWRPDGLLHLYDAVSTPQTVWKHRRDDCDGFAVLAAALLERVDPAHVPLMLTVIVLPLKQAHTVCVFRDPGDGTFRFFDNARLRDERFASLADVAGRVAERGDLSIAWDVVTPDRLRVLEFHRFER